MTIVRNTLTVLEWEARVGEQFRSARLRAGLDQAELADLSAASLSAIKNLEQGKGSTLKTLVRVARALDREDWLGGIAPSISVSPLELLRSNTRNRNRVYRPRAGAR